MGADNTKLIEEFTGVVPEVVSTGSLDAAMEASQSRRTARRRGAALARLREFRPLQKLRKPRRAVQGVGKRKGIAR